MTHLLLVALILMLFLHDGVLADDPMPAGDFPWVAWLVISVLGRAAVALGYAWLIRHAVACLREKRQVSWLHRVNRATAAYQIAIVLFFAADLWMGLLAMARLVVGNDILVDELLVLAPTLALLLWGWWAYYPLERWTRESMMLEQLEAGLAPSHPGNRGDYMVDQVRHQLLLILLPLLAMLAWAEMVMRWGPRDAGWIHEELVLPLTLLGAGVIFLFMPLVVRLLWDARPLPEGPMRDKLLALCADHGIRVRELLLWRTQMGMVNAAVIGLVGWLRYILLTDTLLEKMSEAQVEAVMAHEICHVRRGHMIWLVMAALALAGLLQIALGPLVMLSGQLYATVIMPADPASSGTSLADLPVQEVAMIVGIILALGGWVLLFGFVSRRYERQADTFAVVHLTRRQPSPRRDADGAVVVDVQAVRTMIDALERVADLNHMSVSAPNWRHGSIRWRQDYLRRIVGQPIDKLVIDEAIRWINRLALLGVAILISVQVLFWLMPDRMQAMGF